MLWKDIQFEWLPIKRKMWIPFQILFQSFSISILLKYQIWFVLFFFASTSLMPEKGINHSLLDDEPSCGPMLQHYSSSGAPNLVSLPTSHLFDPLIFYSKALKESKPLDIPGVTLVALTEESSDDEDDDEARKAAVRELPKAQSLKELRFNSKHVVSQVDCLSSSLSSESSFSLGFGR